MPGLLLDMEVQDKTPAITREYGFVVSHQKVELDVDFATQSLQGRCEITILPQTKDLKIVRLDARQCSIVDSKVSVNEVPAGYFYEDPMNKLEIPDYMLWTVSQWEIQKDRLQSLQNDTMGDGSLIIMLPKKVVVEEVDPISEKAAFAFQQRAVSATATKTPTAILDSGSYPMASALTSKATIEQSARFQPLVVAISFMTTNFRDGLHFVGLGENDTRFPHVYTRHTLDPGTASCIFPCFDNPDMRCTWDISIRCSRYLGDALKRPSAIKNLCNTPKSSGKKNCLSTSINHMVEERQVPLSDDEKLLEMTVVCSGELMNETTDLEDSTKKLVSFLCSTVVAPQHIGFAIGPFEQVDLSEFREIEDDDKLGQAQTIPVLGYCLPGRSDELRNTCTPMAHALDWFMLNYGSYPFTECRFVFVDDQIRETEHTASLSLCSSRLLFTEDIIDPELEVFRSLVHAIASQWIGVSIVPNQRCDRWVTIGLSYFMTDLFFKTLCGNNQYVFRLKQKKDLCIEKDFQRPSLYALGEILHVGSFEFDFMALKAPLVLSILDRRIIKASGSVGLTRVLSKIIVTSNTGTSTDSVISSESFRKLTEKITKYRQTETFWNQWVLGAGCPSFVITQRFNKKRLCVEMTITQTQDKKLSRDLILERKSFLRRFMEDIKGIHGQEIQPVFTGPLTIRIHEADGTPYEHIIELREGHAKIEIPYNTKYKRLKRNRLQKERAAAAAEHAGEGGEEALYYCLGDLLTSPAQMREWGLTDWDAEQEASMAQESYEWLRVDADHEWICEKSFTNMRAYMYVSQLQQDRDVAAQYESMMYLKPLTSHPLVATILVRTLMDSRYFYGIRVMGAEFLKTHATKAHNWVGLHQLQKVYQEFFCYPGTKMPRTNDFTDKRAYNVEKAIISSISQIRAKDGTCPKEARHFLLDMLRFNDNTNNEYSDNFKIANLLSALADTLIPSETEPDYLFSKSQEDSDIKTQEIDLQLANNDDQMIIVDTEPEEFKNAVIQELDRYRRMDEWINSYHNIFTVTVLDCKQKLMKAKVIPVNAVEYAQYLHDGTSDFIRIKASEALVDLGFMRNDYVLRLLLNILSTDFSPYIRSHLFEIVCFGLATIGFGDTKIADPGPTNSVQVPSTERKSLLNGDIEANTGNDELIVEEDVSLESRKLAVSQMSSIKNISAALKLALKDNKILNEAIWKAIKSSIIGVNEQLDLLELCRLLYDPILSMIVKLKIPKYWKAINLGKGIIKFKQTTKMRTKPLKPLTLLEPIKSNFQPAPVRLSISAVPVPRTVLPNNSITLKSKTAITGATICPKQSSQTSPTVMKLQPVATKSNVKSTTTISLKPFGSSKTQSKRTQEQTEHSDERPRKIVKLKTANMRKVQLIQSRPPNPSICRGKNPTKSFSHQQRLSSKLGSSPDTRVSSTSTAHSGLAIQPSLSSRSKARRPLPDIRRPLPSGSVGKRQALPGNAPKTPLATKATAEISPPKKGFMLKLKTGGYKGTSSKSNSQ